MKVTSYEQGTPSWVDLSTSDVVGALGFYSALFGWVDEPNDAGDGMVYHMQKLGDDYACAITQQRPDEAEMGVPPHWGVYVTVEDVEASVGRVASAGGQVVAEPFDVMDAGRMAVVADPTGGLVNLWQARQHIGAGVQHEVGSLTWSELITDDPAAAAAFLAEVLGVGGRESPEAGDSTYLLLEVGGRPVAGVMQKTPEMGEIPSVWSTYFEVANVEEALARVESLGGRVVTSVMEEAFMRFAIAEDPQGAVFGLMTTVPVS
jgi:uncharacterized protein